MNDDELRELLDQNFEVAQENNRLLEKIYNQLFWGKVMRALYWLILIGIGVGAFYFLQPFVENILNTYGSIVDGLGELQSFGSSSEPAATSSQLQQ